MTSGPLLVEAERLFDGQAFQSDARLLIDDDGLIGSVGGAVSEDIPRLRLGNATILPGLIDAHVHLCFDTTDNAVENLAAQDDAAALAQMAGAAEFALRAGVTTIRELGARGDLIFRLRASIESGAIEGPHVLAAGRPLTIPLGHCWFLGGVAEDEAGLLELVRTEVERGADVIKIMSTGGAMTPTSNPARPQFAPETLRRAVELAHSLGRPVAAHAHSREGMHHAVAAGVETIEHGTFVGPDGAHVHDDDLSLLAGSRTVLVPTLTPTASRAGMPGALAGALAQGVGAAEFWERRRADVARLFGAGARMIAGSDCGVGHVPHDSVIAEVGYLATAGLTVDQALAAATSTAADVLGVGAATGRLRPGLRADVLVVEGDPARDLGALRRPLAVFKSGRRIL